MPPSPSVTVAPSSCPRFWRKLTFLIAAIGSANYITADMVKPGAVVIDVGINRVDDPQLKRGYRLVGDVDFAAVSQVASAITPVPGGVGPMTVVSLLQKHISRRAWRGVQCHRKITLRRERNR